MALSVMSKDDGRAFLEFHWELANVSENAATLSNFVSMRGRAKAVRFGIQNDVDGQRFTVSFFANQPAQLGLELVAASCRVRGFPWTEMLKHGDQPVTVFTANCPGALDGPRSIVFRALVDYTVPEYSYRLMDGLLNRQLFSAATTADLELVVAEKTFMAHKSLISARSSILAEKLKEHDCKVVQRLPSRARIVVEDVQPAVFETLLKFLYTGEFHDVADRDQLLKAAASLKISTLTELLTRTPRLEGAKAADLIELVGSMKPAVREQPFDVNCVEESVRQTPGGFVLQFSDLPSRESLSAFKFREKTAFGWRFSTTLSDAAEYHVCFYSGLHANSDLRVCDVICRQGDRLFSTTERHQDDDGTLQIFDAAVALTEPSEPICFEVYVRSSVDTVAVELVDALRTEELWTAAQTRQFTDVELRVDGRVFPAHRWVLAARSAVFSRIFSDMLLEEAANSEVVASTSQEVDGAPAIVEIQGIDAATFQKLLRFVYTGTLDLAANRALLEAAEKFDIETLTKLCRAATRPIDIEQLSLKLLSL